MQTSPPAASNWWPYGVAGALAVFSAGLVALILLATRSNNELVAADYYEQEIRYQQQIDRIRRTGELAASARIETDSARGQLRILVPAEHVRQGLAGRIQLYRPSAAGLDRRLPLNPDATGVQALDLASLAPGVWRVQVTWLSGGHEYYTEARVSVPKP